MKTPVVFTDGGTRYHHIAYPSQAVTSAGGLNCRTNKLT